MIPVVDMVVKDKIKEVVKDLCERVRIVSSLSFALQIKPRITTTK